MGNQVEHGFHIPSPREWWGNARSRVSPKALEITGAITAASVIVYLPAEQAGLTYAIHDLGGISHDLINITAVGLGMANAASVALEKYTLEDNGYSASPIGTPLNIITGKPLFSSVVEHVLDYIQLTAPINLIALYNRDLQLLIDNFVAASVIIPFWNIFWNRLIILGKMDPFVDKIEEIKEATWGRIKNRRKQDASDVGLDKIAELLLNRAMSGDLVPGIEVQIQEQLRKDNQSRD